MRTPAVVLAADVSSRTYPVGGNAQVQGSRHALRLRVEPEGGAPFEVSGKVTLTTVLAVGHKVVVLYDPARPDRWEVDEPASRATIDHRDAVAAGGVDIAAILEQSGLSPEDARRAADAAGQPPPA